MSHFSLTEKYRFPAFHLFSAAVLAGVIALLYADTWRVPFLFDDMPNIVLNPFVRLEDLSWESLKKLMTLSPNHRRWVPMLSFGLNHYFDGYDVWGYHAVNTVTHIAAAVSFYLVAHLTLTLPAPAGRHKHAGEIALAAALLWAAHPLQTNGVTYIVQRMTSMAALFYLLALYFYVKARVNPRRKHRIPLFALSGLGAVLAVLSKENSGMFPVVILLYELFFLSRPDIKLFQQKRAILLTAGALVLFGAICFIFLGGNPLASILGGYAQREFTLGQRLLSQTRIIVHYLSLLALPLPSRLNLMYEYQVSTSLFAPPQTLLASAGLAALPVLAVYARKRHTLFGFGISWFLINLLVESSFIPLELVFEHRVYVPSMFLFLAVSAWCYKICGKRAYLARIGLLIILALLAGATWQRNTVWRSAISLWSDVARKSPDSMRAWGNLGNAYSDAKKYGVAEEYLLRALALEKNDKSGNFGRAALRGYAANIHDNLALVYRELHQYQKAMDHANLSLTLNPSRFDPYVTLGIVYAKTDQHAKAYEYFLLAWSKGIESVDLYNNWAVSSFNLGRVDEAIDLLHRALKIDPDHPESHYNLGIAYSGKGMFEEAQREMLRAMRLRRGK